MIIKKILGIDYGKVMTGVSITDSKQIFAFGIDSVLTKDLMIFLDTLMKTNQIEIIVIGLPKTLNNKIFSIEKLIQKFIFKFLKKYPNIMIERLDERFTSKIAFQAMIDLGLTKKHNNKKTILHKISATLILQSYLSKKKK
ncbi:Holliday junction resolvase RuvX [Blattabacterium cuenoti]|uniref:Holliday junction resolvase RuvX n=1 Tax=Blattabacterium cuenoti TaxID=1653831 RepID=UPI00293B8B2C|nr:Holliday junction resolvase RuvX [Blattabacterium cuenoti]